MAVEGMIQEVHDALDKFGAACPMEETVGLCPNLTWNQVFLAIDYLSRTGQVRVIQDQARTYRVQVLHPTVSAKSISATSPFAGVGSGK